MAAGGAPEELVIKDVGTLKALADPLRHHLVSLMDNPRTVKELAAETGRPPDRLYYHLEILERHGLVKAVEERGRERRYQVTAEVISIDPNLAMPNAAVSNLISGMLQRAEREYAAARARKGRGRRRRQAMLGLSYYLLSDDQFEELTKRLEDLLADYEAYRPSHPPAEDDGRRPFGVLRGVWRLDERA